MITCPNCQGELIPLKDKDSSFFAICNKCGKGYNTNYSPPALYYEPPKKCKSVTKKGYHDSVTMRGYNNGKPRARADIEMDIADEQERLKELENQDETGWDEFKKDIQGREVNMPLVRCHIKCYTDELNKLNKNSLLQFMEVSR